MNRRSYSASSIGGTVPAPIRLMISGTVFECPTTRPPGRGRYCLCGDCSRQQGEHGKNESLSILLLRKDAFSRRFQIGVNLNTTLQIYRSENLK